MKEPGGMEIEEDKEIQKAKEILEEISKDERKRYLAELREKYNILDQKAKGLKDGMNRGINQGLIQGQKDEKKKSQKIS